LGKAYTYLRTSNLDSLMKALSIFLGLAAASNISLCGNWMQLSSGRCSLANQCCSNLNTSTTIPTCGQPPTLASSSLISQETYQFAGDGNYDTTLMIATGQSCPLLYSSGTVLFAVDSQGTYTTLGDNTVLGNGWQKVIYTPQRFVATVAKNNQASFFTPGQLVGSNLIGPCMKMDLYLNDLNAGCPCNGTWVAGIIPSGATTANNTRIINVSSCPMVGSNSSCPESFFFNQANRYGNARITNQTNVTRLLEITQPLLNQTLGYNNSVVYANFTADYSCPAVLNNSAPSTAPSTAPSIAPSVNPTRSSAGQSDLNFVLCLLLAAILH